MYAKIESDLTLVSAGPQGSVVTSRASRFCMVFPTSSLSYLSAYANKNLPRHSGGIQVLYILIFKVIRKFRSWSNLATEYLTRLNVRLVGKFGKLDKLDALDTIGEKANFPLLKVAEEYLPKNNYEREQRKLENTQGKSTDTNHGISQNGKRRID